MAEEHHPHQIKVKVTFPASPKHPYEAQDSPQTTVGQVLGAAMSHFEVHDDSQFSYVLSYEGERQDSGTTIGALAEHRDEIKFTLIKVITSG